MYAERNGEMLKVLLLLCGIQTYISVCLRSDMSTASDRNQRPPNHCWAEHSMSDSWTSGSVFYYELSVGLGIILQFLVISISFQTS